jgi:hypothetical protein
MKERPVLFSTSMVQALLRHQNPKSMTRRVMKPQPVWVGDPVVWVISFKPVEN